jgi:hypothetical protein
MSNLKPPDSSPARANVINTEAGQSTTPANGEDVFDPARLRLSQNFADAVGVKKALLTVPVRKPNRQEFVRVHPGKYRISVAVIELKDERETYLVDPAVYPEISAHVVHKQLFTTINREGVLTLWPIRLPGEDGRLDEWSKSALRAADMATQSWVRVASNMSLGAYEVFQATGDIPEPQWPDVGFKTILATAFEGRFVQSLDHPVIRRLNGAD